jgi:formyl-CoA transferase/CoA:oxalate CoA-transferase
MEPPASHRPAPLDGVRVLDLTRVLSGPYATLLLADLGAEVWKIEHPVGGDETRVLAPHLGGESHYFMSVNRNKRGLAIDLNDPRGRDLALRLAQAADVVTENFRPGVAERLGLAYSQVQAVNPRIVYCSISAFGQTGPAARRTAYDVAVQALGGLMSLTGEPGRPPVRAGVPMADLAAGMLADLGILAALLRRERTGKGEYVDASMLDGMLSLLSYFAGRYLLTGEEVSAVGAGHPSVVPYGLFPTADGQIVLATLSESYWPTLCRVLDLPSEALTSELLTNAGRLLQRKRVETMVAEALRRRSTAAWEERLLAADIPYAPVLSVGQALTQPQAVARQMVQPLDHPRLGQLDVVGSPVKFTNAGAVTPQAAPLLGEHTRQVLTDVLGLDAATLDALEQGGVLSAGSGTAEQPDGP